MQQELLLLCCLDDLVKDCGDSAVDEAASDGAGASPGAGTAPTPYPIEAGRSSPWILAGFTASPDA